jgi:hypothetical protein
VLLAENSERAEEERSVRESTREGDTTARGDERAKRYDASVSAVGGC